MSENENATGCPKSEGRSRAAYPPSDRLRLFVLRIELPELGGERERESAFGQRVFRCPAPRYFIGLSSAALSYFTYGVVFYTIQNTPPPVPTGEPIHLTTLPQE